MPWTVYNSDGQILQGSATLANDSVNSQHYVAASIDNEHLADDAVGADELAANAVVNASIASGAAIDATKIADGSVTSTEFQYINTLSSNAQTQIAAKQATINSSARLDASVIGANGNVSNTEYGYLSGVTSDIQTQLSAAGGAVVREGGQTTEATSNSTSLGDVLTAASLSIAAAEPFHQRNLLRKTSGAGVSGGSGIKLNSTTVAEGAVLNGSTESMCGAFSTANEAQVAMATNDFCATVTDYAFTVGTGTYTVNANGIVRKGRAHTYTDTAERPTATITSFIMNTISGNSSVTIGCDELQVYSLAVS